MIFHSILWVNWSWISCIPLVTCTIYRFATQENFLKESPKKYYTDEIFRLLLVPSMIYYIVDTLVLVIQVPSSWCSISFLVHHIITLSGTKTMMTLPHYPWFIMGPFAMHTFLIMFPQYYFFELCVLVNYFFLLSRTSARTLEEFEGIFVGIDYLCIACVWTFGNALVQRLQE
jgi:hypothetical protein